MRRETVKRSKMYGMGYVYPRKDSRFLWCYYSVDGIDYYESTKQTSEAKARRFLRDRMDEKGKARSGGEPFLGPKQERILMGELFDDLEKHLEAHGKFHGGWSAA